jgi:MGT family glycosyltransferase
LKKALTIAVFTHMLNGHVYPVLPICSELTARGHRILYATSKQFGPFIEATRAEPVFYQELLPPNDLVKMDNEYAGLPASDPRFMHLVRAFLPFQFEETDSFIQQVSETYANDLPDLILYDRYHLGGRILADKLHVPAAQVWCHFAYYQGLATREDGVCKNLDIHNFMSSRMDDYLRRHGAKCDRSYWHVEGLNIHLIPPEFQHHSDWFDTRFCFTGTVMNRTFSRNWVDRSDGKPIILISGLSGVRSWKKNNDSYYHIMAEALQGLPCHCILSIGDDRLPIDLPKNFECNRSSSHMEILPRASLSIGAGGMGTTLEALYHGVPALIIPVSALSTEVAYRVEELGLGAKISRDVSSVDNIKRTVQCLLADSELANRLTEMKMRMRTSGGAKEAASRIEEFAYSRL